MLYIIRGLPGSGKTTVAGKLALDRHYEADQYFEADGEYQFDPTKLAAAHKWCQDSVREALEDGFTVSVANTFTRISEIRPYVELAEYLGVDVVIITCTAEYGSVHGVPEHTMERMRERFATQQEIFAEWPDVPQIIHGE